MPRIPSPVHPGEMLREEYLAQYRLTPYALAKAISVPRTRIERLCREERPVTPDTALRLGRYFGTTPDYWMGMQVRYDLTLAEAEAADEIAAIEPRITA